MANHAFLVSFFHESTDDTSKQGADRGYSGPGGSQPPPNIWIIENKFVFIKHKI